MDQSLFKFDLIAEDPTTHARAGVLHPVVSYSTEFIEIWFARGLQPGERRLDEGEFKTIDVREAIERLQAGIEPALTVILGMLLLAVMSAVMLPIYDIVTRMKI